MRAERPRARQRILLKCLVIQSADRTTGLVSITLFTVVHMGVHCRPHPSINYLYGIIVSNRQQLYNITTFYSPFAGT